MASDTIKRNVAEVRAVMGTDAKRIDEAGRRAMQKHIAPTVPPGVKRDMILVERVMESGFCNAIGVGRCPHFMAKNSEVAGCHLWPDETLPWHLEGFLQCPQCLATPSAVVLTAEMLEAVNKIVGTIEHMLKEHMVHIEANALVGLIRSAKALRAAFPQIEEATK